jgi:pimeloyl-ACP methyl ester carboxylesterase
MAEAPVQFLDVGTGAARRRIAYRSQAGASGAAGLVWLCGLRSEMASTKADALTAWTAERGLACTRFDYSGHGQSDCRFEDGTISTWLEEARAVFTALTRGEQIVVGSSMGGWIALLLLRDLLATAPEDAQRVRGLVLLAPAWDMTEALMWQQFPPDVRDEISRTGVYLRPSEYGDGPYPITRALIEDGRRHLIKDKPFDPGRPIEIVQGRRDPDVPWTHAQRLAELLPGGRVRLTIIEDGEHRLSRPQDLAVLFATLERLLRPPL